MSSTEPAAPQSTRTVDDPLDAAIAPFPEETKQRPAWVGIAGAMTFPLFFVIMFSLTYVSAFHAPAPHNAPVYIVGQSAQTSAIVDGIDKEADGAFDLKTTGSVTVAKRAILDREAIGAIEVSGTAITVYDAAAAGPITSSTVQRIATELQAQTQAQVTKQAGKDAPTIALKIVNLAPLAVADSVGTGLFYFFIICTIGGYLTVTILAQVGAGIRHRAKYFTVFLASVLAPPITFALSSIFVGNYGLDVGHVFALLGLGAFYTFTVGSIALLANQLAGRASIFLVMTLAIFLNFPSVGGAIPYTFLPGFWQGVHSFWFGSGAMEAMRDLVYFNGTGMWPWLMHTAIWLLIALALSAVLNLRAKTAPAQSAVDEDRPHHRHAEGAVPVA